jgi:hypothetical protein
MADKKKESVARKARPGSALGQLVGGMIERRCNDVLRANLPKGYNLWDQYHLPPDYPRKVLKIADLTGKLWQIDGLVTVGDKKLIPVAIVDPKYIQRTKWCYDKGGWLCTAHPLLRRTYRTIRGTMTILAGRWSPDSIATIKQHGIRVVRLPYEHIQQVMGAYGVDMSWKDEDSDWAAIPALRAFNKLPESTKEEIPIKLVKDIEGELIKQLAEILGDEESPRDIERISIQVATNKGETIDLDATTIQQAIEKLSTLNLAELFEKNIIPFTVQIKPKKTKGSISVE